MHKEHFVKNGIFYKQFFIRNPWDIIKPYREAYFSTLFTSVGIPTITPLNKSFKFRKGHLVATLEYMEYPNFTTLDDCVKPLANNEKVRICKDAFLLMARIHSMKIRHGDLTHHNFYVDNGLVGVYDFETVKRVPFARLVIRDSYKFFKYCIKNISVEAGIELFNVYLNELTFNDKVKQWGYHYVIRKAVSQSLIEINKDGQYKRVI